MSSKYLQQTASPNEAINLRCNDLTVDGTLTASISAIIPDPLTLDDIIATDSMTYTQRKADLSAAVTQITSATTDVTLNAQMGVITTFSTTIKPGEAQVFGLQNNLIGANTWCRVHLMDYSGVVTPPGVGLVAVSGITGPGQCAIQIINPAVESGAPGSHDLVGFFKIGFELIQPIV